MNHKDRKHESHTLDDDCRYGSALERASGVRAGHHPRDPAIPDSVSDTSHLRASSARGELGGEEDRALDEQLQHERQRRREKEEARKADRDNDDLGMDGLIPNDEAVPSASGGNPDAECVGEARPPKPKVVRKPHFGPRTRKDTVEDEERAKRERK